MDIKKTWEKLPCLSHHIWPSHCLSIEISNSASPRRAVYKRPLPIVLREMLHFVQHDKMMARGHRLGVINARSGRFVAVSSNGIKVAKFDMVEDNVQKTSFSCSLVRLGVGTKSTVSGALSEHGIQYVLTHPSLEGWLSRCEVSNYL